LLDGIGESVTIHINWLSVFVAALATFVIGGPWYSPALFLRPWQEAMNITVEKRGHPIRVFGLAYIFSVQSCALLASMLGPDAGATRGLGLGLLVGTAFVAASYGINYQFANRSLVALSIDGGFHILQFAAFGIVLGAWPTLTHGAV
jgi:Protein of unknown function (DUF1761)